MDAVHEIARLIGDIVGGALVAGTILGIFVGPVYIRTRERERQRKLLQETLQMAYDRGQPLPPELVEALQSSAAHQLNLPTRERDLRRAIILLAVGLGFAGLGAGMGWGIYHGSDVGGQIVGGIVAGCGAIPAFLGLAYLILWMTRSGSRRS
jgi:hypothetical protein